MLNVMLEDIPKTIIKTFKKERPNAEITRLDFSVIPTGEGFKLMLEAKASQPAADPGESSET